MLLGEVGVDVRLNAECIGFAARGDQPFTIHLTYPIDEIDEERKADWDKMRHQFESAWGDIAAGFGRAWSRFR